MVISFRLDIKMDFALWICVALVNTIVLIWEFLQGAMIFMELERSVNG